MPLGFLWCYWPLRPATSMPTWILPDYYIDVWINLMHDNKLEPNYMRLDLFYEFYLLNCYYTTVIHLKTSLYLRLVYYSFIIIQIGNVCYILKVITLVFKLDDYSSVYSQRYPYISPFHFPLFRLQLGFGIAAFLHSSIPKVF